MKAVVLNKYGSADYLELKEVEKPSPKDDEVLIKVQATSINSWDWDLLKGIPFANRVMFGLFKPNNLIMGCDVSGQVEETGRNVTRLQVGDEIFGDISDSGMGSYAEYVCAKESPLALKPESISFNEAAAIPHTGVLALQGLRDKGKIQEGHKVLINGAGGGSGTFAVQIAKSVGAEVTCVDRSEKFDMLRTIGADHFIDYKKEDFTKNGKVYDLILDVITYRSIFEYKRMLSPAGTYVMLGGGDYNKVFQGMALGAIMSKTNREGKKMGLLMHKPNADDLNYLVNLYESGKLKPVIDKVYPLSGIPEALRYFGDGLTQGKLIITN